MDITDLEHKVKAANSQDMGDDTESETLALTQLRDMAPALAGMVVQLAKALEKAKAMLSRTQSMPLLIKAWEKSSRNNAHDQIATAIGDIDDALAALDELEVQDA